MKSHSFSHWEMDSVGKGLLFFAQSIEEMLFHYGHDSLKAPALNFHFLCVEISKTINKIQKETIEKAHMRHLLDELQDSFNRDPIAKKLLGSDFKSQFYVKDSVGSINRDCSGIFKDPCSDTSIRRISHVIDYFIHKMKYSMAYFTVLKEDITRLIKLDSLDDKEQDDLYHLSRLLVTELINNAYSQEYVYMVINDVFYNRDNIVDDTNDVLEFFWSHFDFRRKEYVVKLPLKQAALQKHLCCFKDISVKINTEGYFRGACKWIVELTTSAMDPYQAQSNAVRLVGFFVSLLQYNNHRSQSYTANYANVTLKDTDRRYNLQIPITPLKRGIVLPKEQGNEKTARMVGNRISMSANMLNVIELHSSAVNSADIENQLLNLWTIIEVLVPTEAQKNQSKINQICNTMTTVLNAQYISSLLSQLVADLFRCIPDVIETELQNVTMGRDNIQRVTALLIFPEHETKRANIISALHCYPLLQYRIEHYAAVLSNRQKIKCFLATHRKRLNWHITRIYRNRNMIVHDGTHFPYIDIIVQNLHYYVDVLIDTINHYAEKGYQSINTMYTSLHQREFKHLLSLERVDSNKSAYDIKEDFVEVVLGYLD